MLQPNSLANERKDVIYKGRKNREEYFGRKKIKVSSLSLLLHNKRALKHFFKDISAYIFI